MGQGFGVAQGFAIAGRISLRFDSYCMCGDGELQEGPIWEAVMFAGAKRLDNLCLMVDRNHGQLDIHSKTVFPMPDLAPVFRSFGWQAIDVDATQYDGIYAALEEFRYGPRNGKPTAIICSTAKGYGSLSDFFNRHKVAAADSLIAQELGLQNQQRQDRVAEFGRLYIGLESVDGGAKMQNTLANLARGMHLDLEVRSDEVALRPSLGPVALTRVPPRNKKVAYDASLLPGIDRSKEYAASDIVTAAMKVFARDPAVVSIDSDLASTSGLEAGVAAVDQRRALNVGVAEANMMLIGEAFAALGCNTWISTFCPFYDWKVLRRVVVGQQERHEAMEAADGWLSEGHGLDLTMLATASNFETRTNGATHMANDDCLVFDAIAHLKIIDVSCPQQMLAVMKWIMEGNRGLVYVRLMRTGSPVIYGPDYGLEFGRGHVVSESPGDAAIVVSSGRGAHEALGAAGICAKHGIGVTVVDLPSIDDTLLLQLYDSRKLLIFAEQNNGYIWQNFLKVMYRHRKASADLARVATINTLDSEGRPQFIHSGTYEELTEAFGLTGAQIAAFVEKRVNP
jgi:transketolase